MMQAQDAAKEHGFFWGLKHKTRTDSKQMQKDRRDALRCNNPKKGDAFD